PHPLPRLPQLRLARTEEAAGILAMRAGGVVAIELLGALVPEAHAVVEAGDDDRLARVIEQRGLLAHALLRAAPFAEVSQLAAEAFEQGEQMLVVPGLEAQENENAVHRIA